MFLFCDVFTYFTRHCRVPIVDFEQENVCQEPVLQISIYLRADRRQRSTVFVFNFEHISHLVLVLVLLILSMYLFWVFILLGFSYFSRFYIKMNSNFIVYSFLERISMKWNAHSIFIINFSANCNVNFLSFLSFDK